MVVPAAADLSKAAKAGLDSNALFKQFNAKANIDSTKNVTLVDGKTPGAETELSAQIAIYGVYSYCVAATKGDNSIMLFAYSVHGDKALVQEIAKTLAFK
jgi:hypothetical protein